MSNPAHNIYIHVPFCVSKCNYCAFFSRPCEKPDWENYADRIIKEICHWGRVLGSVSVPTIFFGGGTPSLMPVKTFEKIMDALRANFCVDDTAEVTLESNPGTIDAEKLSDFISAGVNRLSVGVQSFDDERLKFLGRRHTSRQAFDLLYNAMSRGIRVSGDFIYGLPHDTVRDVITMCNRINSLDLRHCSMYELTLEPTTPFGRMNLDMPDNDTMADMYSAIGDTLNLPRYEVSNYAGTDDVCRHNQNVWDGAPYVGIGQGAAGRVFVNDIWYEEQGAGAMFSKLDTHTRAIEKIITGMRTMRGVKLTPDVRRAINTKFVADNPELVYVCGDRMRTTQKGLLTLDDLTLNLVN